MVGSVMGMGDNNGGAEVLIGDFDPNAIFSEPLPPLAVTNDVDLHGQPHAESKQSGKREIVLGRNVHTTCFAVTEPDANDESTGDKDAYMASVLARYRKNLVERTKHHLGFFLVSSNLCLVSVWEIKRFVRCSDLDLDLGLDLYFRSLCFRLPL